MSATVFTTRLRDEFDAHAAGLPEAPLPLSRRRAALDRLVELGLPGLRDDAWRYSNLRPLQAAALAPVANQAAAAGGVLSLLATAVPAADGATPRLVFIDGRLDEALSSSMPAGQPLEALGDPADAVPGHGPDTRFALLNDIFAVDAARFRVRGTASLELVFIASGGASYPRVEIDLEPGSELTLVERHLGGGAGSLSSAVTRLTLARDARCRLYRAQDLDAGATHIEALHARLEANASLEAVLLQLGGGSVRSTLDCELAGRAASAQLNSVSLATASRTLDSRLDVTHAAPDTVSQQELRAIAGDRASIAYQSHVMVRAEAAGADSRQSLKGLIRSGTAEVNLRPQLEIDTDAVRASHGATTGAIDEGMLFYLLSRGLDAETARQLLEWAFIETVLGRIGLPALRREFETRAVAHLRNRAAMEVLA